MDPTACLGEMLELSAELVEEDVDLDDLVEGRQKATRLAELVQALDGWMMTGGFMPQQWYEARSDLPPATQPATLEE